MPARQHVFLPPDTQLAQRGTPLAVDDEANVLAAPRRSFRRAGFKVLTASCALRGLE